MRLKNTGGGQWSVVLVLMWLLVVLMLVVPAVDSRPAAMSGRGRSNNRRRVTTTRRPPRARVSNDDLDPDLYLERFGYLPNLGGVQHEPRTRKQAIKSFQRMTGLNVTGLMDRPTQRKMLSPRCGMPDMVPPSIPIPDDAAREPGAGEPVPFYVPGYKWTKTSLTWRAVNYSPDMSSGSQRRAFTEAFRQWSDVTPLQFREVSSRDVDIEIKFAGRGEHGDNNPFDGPGMTLAHAFYPESGDTHFDESETWTERTDEGTNLMIVAAHEFGHALGLGHSNIPEALMAPFYRYDPNFSLHDDDVRGIQNLYGSSRPPARPTAPSRPARPGRPGRPTPTPRPTQAGRPDTCTTKFDAVFQAHDNRIYAFKYKWMWRMNYYGTEEGFPKVARKFFQKPPYNIAAAVYSWRTRYTYFFKSNKVWTYYGYTFIRKKTITTRGYPRSIQSAFMGRDGRIYLLTGANYYIFDEGRMDVIDISRRTISSKWRGVPANIEAAVRLNDGYIYFFKGARYRKFSEYYGRVLDGYPKDKAGPWMGSSCTADGRYERK